MSVDMNKVALNGGFLREKHLLNTRVTMAAVWDRFQESGRIDAFRFDWKEGMEPKPHFYWDSDVAKWMEAAAYLLGQQEDPALREKMEWVIDRIQENQLPNGYFNIYFTVCEPDKKFSIRDDHELYCAGHLIEAACAYREHCGDTRFLELMRRYADHIYQVFYVEKSAAFTTPGHEEIELALLRLYCVTGEKRYLELAMYFLNTRGTQEDQEPQPPRHNPMYVQSHLPVRQQREAVGHAVRALYLYTAMAHGAAITGDTALKDACDALFADLTEHKMYITGGLGQCHVGEAFTSAYDLKNSVAYAETCASIAMILFCEKMWDLHHSGIYGDVIERELYNGMMSGLSLTGREFFYTNPLEIDLDDRKRSCDENCSKQDWLPITQRPEIFSCSCCPPNLNRTLASVSRLLYSAEGKRVYIDQFADSTYTDGDVQVTQHTDYPHSGEIRVTARNAEAVYIRIPGWCTRYEISAEYVLEDGYARVFADTFTLKLDMEPQLLMANQAVAEDANRVAVVRGPVVYCAEGVDNNAKLHRLYIRSQAPIEVEESDYFGLPVLTAQGYIRETSGALYSPLSDCFQKTNIRLIPYCGFANRGETDMRVWLNCR